MRSRKLDTDQGFTNARVVVKLSQPATPTSPEQLLARALGRIMSARSRKIRDQLITTFV